MRVLDLFSGIGGFSLGLERAGFRTVAFCEIEPFCRAVLRKHWPEVPCYDDIRTLSADVLERDGIAVDAICGGFPCQDLSFAGKRAGLEGARSGLWGEYRRLIGEIRPRFVIVENVPGLLSLGMGTVLGDLSALGYDAVWDCVPASAVSAPHRRDRVWIVAYTQSERRGEAGRNRRDEPAQRASSGGEVLADTDNTGLERRQRASLSERGGERVTGASGAPVRDATGARLSNGFDREMGEPGAQPEPERSGWWFTISGLGRSAHGFPDWLDLHIGEAMNGADEKERAIEALRNVWSDHVSKTLLRAAGGLGRVQQAEVLFAFVRQLQAGSENWDTVVAGAQASEESLRSLRIHALSTRAPRRPKSREQRPDEPSNAVQALPQLLAYDSEASWAGSSWEDAIPRVSTGEQNRASRLTALGNAVVPQVVEAIGRAVMEG